MKMKLTKFLELIQEAVNEAAESKSEHKLPADPDIVFSMGKPTENKLIEPHGMGTARSSNGEVCFFIDFQPATNLLKELEARMREVMGDEKADEILAKVKNAAATIKEKVDADSGTA